MNQQKNPIKKTRGRKKTTGRFQTRDELVDAVWSLYLGSKSTKITDVARFCKVSLTTVSKILDQPRPKKIDQ